MKKSKILQIDLFETPELLPQNLQNTLMEFGEVAASNGWNECLVSALLDIMHHNGYTFEYGLDLEPHSLKNSK